MMKKPSTSASNPKPPVNSSGKHTQQLTTSQSAKPPGNPPLIQKLNEEVKSLTEELKALKIELNNSNRTNEQIITELNEKSSKKDIEIMSLNSELATAQQRCDALTAQSAGLKQHAEEKALNAQSEVLQENQKLRDQMNQFKEKEAKNQIQIEILQEKIENLQNDLEEKDQVIAELEERKIDLESELALESQQIPKQATLTENLTLDETSPEVIEVHQQAEIQIEKFNETQKTLNSMNELKIDKNMFKQAINESKELITKQVEMIDQLRLKNEQIKRFYEEQILQLNGNLQIEMQQKEVAEEGRITLQNTITQMEYEMQDMMNQQVYKSRDSTILSVKNDNQSIVVNGNQAKAEDVYHSLVVPSGKSLEKVQYSEMKRRISALQMEVQELSRYKDDIRRLNNDNDLLRRQLGEKTAQVIEMQQYDGGQKMQQSYNKSFTKVSMMSADEIPNNLQIAMQRVQNTTPSFMTNLLRNKTLLEEPSLLEQVRDETLVSNNKTENIQDLMGDNVEELKNALMEAKNEYDAMQLVIAQKSDKIIDLQEEVQQLQTKNDKLNRKLKKTLGNNINLDVAGQETEIKEEIRKRRLVEIEVQDFQVQVGLVGVHGESMLLKDDKQTQYKEQDISVKKQYTLVSDDNLEYKMSKDGWFDIKKKGGVLKYKILGDSIVNQQEKLIKFNGYLKSGDYIYQVDQGKIIKEQTTPYIEANSEEALSHRMTFPAMQTQIDLYKKDCQRLDLDNASLRNQIKLLQSSLLDDNQVGILQQVKSNDTDESKNTLRIEQVCQTDVYMDSYNNIFNNSMKAETLQEQLEQLQVECQNQLSQSQNKPFDNTQQLNQQQQLQPQQFQPQQFSSPSQPIIVYPPMYPLPYMQQQSSNLQQQNDQQAYNQSQFYPQQQLYPSYQQPQQQHYQFQPQQQFQQQQVQQQQIYQSPQYPEKPINTINQQKQYNHHRPQLIKGEQTIQSENNIDQSQYEQLKLKLNYLTSENAKLTLQTQQSSNMKNEFNTKQQELQNCVKYIKTLNERIRDLETQNMELQEQIQVQRVNPKEEIQLNLDDVFKLQHKATQNSFISLQNRLIQKDTEIHNLNIILEQQRSQHLQTIEIMNQQILKFQQQKSIVDQNKLDQFNNELLQIESQGQVLHKNAMNKDIISNLSDLKNYQTVEIAKLESELNKTKKAAKKIKEEYIKINNQYLNEKRINIQFKDSLQILFRELKYSDLQVYLDAECIDQLRNEVQKKFSI